MSEQKGSLAIVTLRQLASLQAQQLRHFDQQIQQLTAQRSEHARVQAEIEAAIQEAEASKGEE